MNLKNYTSDVSPISSINKIEKYLIEAGATDISKKYNNGNCTAITFRITHKNIPVFFQLPAKVDACFQVLMKNKSYDTEKIRKGVRAQAEKTAWKIISDWVEIQISMIKLEQAEAIEIFLPYVYNPATEQTFYQQIKNTNYKALLT